MVGDSEPSTTNVETPQRSIMHLIISLMSGALLSKGLGFVREIAMAILIGTAAVADSFRTSITAILLPISFFQAETVPAVLIPMQKQALYEGGRETAATSLSALTIALALIALVLMVGMQTIGFLLIDWMVAGFGETEKRLTFEFVQVMALAMPASVMLNVLAAGEIALGRARIANARAALQNLSVLIGIAGVALGGDIILLGWAFSLSFNTLALWSCITLGREGNMSMRGVGPRRVLAVARLFFVRLKPFIPLPIAEQANIWIERFFTSRLQTGAVASLDYARTLTESFQLLISQPVGLGVLAGADRDRPEGQAAMISRLVLAFSVPACAFLFVFAEDIITIIFERGAFGDTGVMLTSQALKGISTGLWASTLGWILLRLLNSANRNIRAAFILICAYAVNIAFNAVVSGYIQAMGSGILLIGLGETSRALVLLGGVLISMPNGRRIFPLIGIAIIPAAVMLAAGMAIEQSINGLFLRLFLGVLTFIISAALGLAVLMPGIYRTGFSFLRQRIRG